MKENKKIQYIVLSIIILILIAINIRIFINNYFDEDVKLRNTQNKISETNQNILVSKEDDDQNREKKIATLTERNRMQTYFGTYLSYVESKKYEEAYDLLYEGFKQTYFPTLVDFKNYAEENYTSNMIVNYTDITREGTMYILTVEIKDALSSKQTEAKNINAVVMEEDVNKFKISFDTK